MYEKIAETLNKSFCYFFKLKISSFLIHVLKKKYLPQQFFLLQHNPYWTCLKLSIADKILSELKPEERAFFEQLANHIVKSESQSEKN